MDDIIIAYYHSLVIGKTVPILCKFAAITQGCNGKVQSRYDNRCNNPSESGGGYYLSVEAHINVLRYAKAPESNPRLSLSKCKNRMPAVNDCRGHKCFYSTHELTKFRQGNHTLCLKTIGQTSPNAFIYAELSELKQCYAKGCDFYPFA